MFYTKYRATNVMRQFMSRDTCYAIVHVAQCYATNSSVYTSLVFCRKSRGKCVESTNREILAPDVHVNLLSTYEQLVFIFGKIMLLAIEQHAFLAKWRKNKHVRGRLKMLVKIAYFHLCA